MKAHAADALVETIGLNWHPDYDDTVNFSQFANILALLIQAGVRHVRLAGFDKSVPKAGWYYKLIRQATAKGVKVTLLSTVPRPGKPNFDPADLEWAVAQCGGPGVIAAIEGPNEVDIDSSLPDWVNTVPAYQKRLYQTVKASAALKGIPVLAPSLVGNEGKVAGKFADCCDFNNMHPYPNNEKPSKAWEWNEKRKALPAPGKLFWATEVGWHNAVKWVKSPHKGVSEATSGTYTPILLLDLFSHNVLKTFLYETVDLFPNPARDEMGHNWGQLRNDLSEKPAFTAIKRLIALHADPGKPFAPKDLELSVKGPDSTRSLLFQKSDGTYLLDVWRDVEVGTKAAEVTVKLPKAVAGYKVHPFDGPSVSFTPGKEASRAVIDITTTLDKTTLEPLYAKRSERTEMVSAGGVDLITVPVGSSVVTLEFTA